MSIPLYTLATAQTTDDPDDKAKDVVLLSPFEVVQATGYTSTMTSSGTRIRANLRDLPMSVGVVTSEFLNDFAAFNDYKDSLAYTSGVTTNGNYNQGYYIRGMSNDGQLRNGFFRAGMFDAVNVDRIEVIKGPNAAIYGRAAPGGTINVVTKTPPSTFQGGLQAWIGGQDTRRYSLNLGGPLTQDKRLRFRLDAASDDRYFYYDSEKYEQKTVSGVLQYLFDSGSKITFEADWLDKLQNAPAGHTLFRRVGGVVTSELATELGSFSPMSEQAYINRILRGANLTFEHMFTDKVRFRTTAHASERPVVSFRNLPQEYYTVETRTVGGRRTEYRDQPSQYKGLQSDLLFDFSLGQTQHKLLVSYDYSQDSGDDVRWRVASSDLNNPLVNIQTLSIDSPNYFMTPDLSQLKDNNRDTDDATDTNALFVSDQMSFAENRGLLLLGTRQNWVHSTANDNRTGGSSDIKRKAFTYQAGLNWKLSEPVSTYVNYSTSYLVNSGLDDNGKPWDNQNGKGGEIGLKAELLDKRLALSLAYFDITHDNILKTNSLTQLKELTGEENSKGVELDFHYKVNESWLVFGHVTQLKARITDNADDPTLVGFQLPFVPDNSYGIATRYDFRGGALNGLFVTLGLKHMGEITTNTGAGYLREYRQAAYTQLDGSIGYIWKGSDRLQHKVSVILTDITDEKAYFGDRVRSPGFVAQFSYSIAFK